MPSISVVLPVFNGSAYLNAAVTSVLSQEFRDWELLIVDDGSTDGSYEMGQDWQSKDPRIKIFRHEEGLNRGVSASRNVAIRHASSEWIALLDADDIWYSEKLKRQ